MDAIELDRVQTDECTVRYEFSYPKALRRFFTGDDLLVEYDVPIADVPDGILSIPWLANVCPIAWASGTDVSVPVLDSVYAESIPRVGTALKNMYPRLVNESTIHVAETDSDAVDSGESGNSAMLFSGGVDSVATYYRHSEEEPLLICVHGHDVDLEDTTGWDERRSKIEQFAGTRGLETSYIRTNMGSFQEAFMLYAHFGSDLYSDWTDSVHLGLGLTGLCAPLTDAEQVDTVYLADSINRLHVASSVDKVANHPTVIREIELGRTNVQNDGYPLTRQEKIDHIVNNCRDGTMELHVCLESTTENCSRCEKCLRTAFPLVLAGADPNRYGFDIDGETFEYAREQFATGAWKIDAKRILHWEEIQLSACERKNALDFDVPEAAAFFEWLATSDVNQFRERDIQLRRQLLCAAARNTPYPVYRRAKDSDSVVSLATQLLNR